MTELLLDGAFLQTPKALHEALARGLALPAWYGRNLDALYDCLTELGADTRITLRNARALGAYGDRLALTLGRAAAVNPRLSLDMK